VQSGHWPIDKKLTEMDVKNMLSDKIHNLDFNLVKQDVIPFLNDSSSTDLWSKPFFDEVVSKIKII